MSPNNSNIQQIAVFGESGSGKTVLVSSFYGATQDPQQSKDKPFRVFADDASQGTSLNQNYLGMKNSAKVPQATRFAVDSYSFTFRLKDASSARAEKAMPFDALRLVWHDYPGEWFETRVVTPEELQRKVDTFRSLLGSDVALLLVDGQKLLDNSGEEERYLKSLFSNVRAELLRLKGDLLPGGKRLLVFPRIWVLALSKSDLLPEMDVSRFKELVIEKAGDDINEVRAVLMELVETPAALSFGDDFMRLSSARFGDGNIEVSKRVGVDLIVPVAAILPFETFIRWRREKKISGDLAERLLRGAPAFAKALLGFATKLPGPIATVVQAIGPDVLDAAFKLLQDRLQEANEKALAKHDYLSAALTGFRMDLNRAEKDNVLLTSQR